MLVEHWLLYRLGPEVAPHRLPGGLHRDLGSALLGSWGLRRKWGSALLGPRSKRGSAMLVPQSKWHGSGRRGERSSS